MPNIKVIVGTTRQGRFGIQPAQWIMELAKEYPAANFELVDLAEQDLPFFSESTPPLMVKDGQYEAGSSRKWSKIIDEADGFVVITAEYNYSIPAVLKNAIDTLNHEWGYKPIVFVSYGANAGGARAVDHLRGIAGGLKLYDLQEHVLIANYWGHLGEAGKFEPTEQHIQGAKSMLEAIVFWADQMKLARKALTAAAK